MKHVLVASAFCSLVLLLLGSPVARAQGVGASGDINGTVTDPSGAVIPNAAVVATETARGTSYTATTGDSGQYRLIGLLPATYNVTVRVAGFATMTQNGVVVSLGETTIADFSLKVAATGQVVEVTAAPPVIDTQRGSQANTLTETYITNLPIDRRDYLTFTLLMPGVSNSTRIADDQDFRVKQTPQSGLSFYGSNGRGNSVTVDGGEALDDSGGVRLTVSQDAVQEFQVNRSNYAADLGGASGATINIVSKSGTNDLHGSLYSYFRNDALDARDPFAFKSALAPDPTFSNFDFTSVGAPVKNNLSRYQYGGTVGFPIRKEKTFLFVAFEGLLQNSQNSVPLLTNSSIFAGPNAAVPVPLCSGAAQTGCFGASDPRAAQQAIISGLAASSAPSVPCINNPDGSTTVLSAQQCAFALTSVLAVSPTSIFGLTPPGQVAINQFLITQFENNGGLFNYNTREYLASGRLDHRISDADQLTLTFRYGHDLEENPDVQSLTGFSAGSSIHNYDDNLLGAWYHTFSPTAQNELRVQWDYNGFNVIPNEPGEVGLQIPGFANNLGTNIFLPDYTILRRYEFADNFTLVRGRHTIKFGGSELLRGDHAESHTFFPGRFVFGTLPGGVLSDCLAAPAAACGLSASLSSAVINSLQTASLGAPQVYQQGFGNPDYPAYTRPLTGLYVQDSWRITPGFTLNYGLRYEIDSQFLPLNTYYKDFGPRISFAWDPFNDHKTVIRGGYGIFYGPIDAQIPQVDLSLGVLNKNNSTVENQNNAAQVPDQVNNVVNTCGIGFPGFPIFPGSGTSACKRFISIYIDPLTPTGLPIQNSAVVFQTLFGAGLIQCTKPTPGNAACITPQSLLPMAAGGLFPNPLGSGIFAANSGQLGPLQVLFSNPPNYKPPYSQQASLAIEREISPGFSISLSGIYSHTTRLPVAIDTNLLKAPLSTVTLANGQTVSYRNWNTSAAADPLGGTEVPGGVFPCAITLNGFGQPVSPCFVNPLIVQNNQYTAAASALYEGGIVEIKKQFSDHFTVFGNYTYSKAFDTSTDFNSDYGPQDPTNLGLDRALSAFDQRHKVVIAGVVDSPWKEAILSGFQVAPIFTYTSGHPFNLLAGGEVNGNGHTTNERPIGAPRDSGLGPNLIDFDMRLTWQHKLNEKVSLQFTAEGFNLANRTNFASVNNEVSPLFGFQPGFTTFNVHGIRPGTALAGGGIATSSTPLTFTSALPKREFQFGARLNF
ncbi:MAG: carboxypeptidase regulatory-like domain-containing protein [Candidatus Acidiferrales bacterium]